MKVTLTLPDWVDTSTLRITHGMEEVARKLPNQPWEIKQVRCALCGACCKGCEHLEIREGYKQPNGEPANMCRLNANMPFVCSSGDDSGEEHCSIKWKRLGS